METTATTDYPGRQAFEDLKMSIQADREADMEAMNALREIIAREKQEIREIQRENAQEFEKRQKETEREIKESQRETERLIKENQQEAARRLEEHTRWLEEKQREKVWQFEEKQKEFDRQLKEGRRKQGFFENRFGEILEYMASPGLMEKFKSYGFTIVELSHDKEIHSEGHLVAQLDMFLENGDSVVAVEMKSKPDAADINEQVERMEKLRKYADRKGDKRKYYGAIGGVVFLENIRNYALKCGLFVIEPSGVSFNLLAPEGNKPRAW